MHEDWTCEEWNIKVDRNDAKGRPRTWSKRVLFRGKYDRQ